MRAIFPAPSKWTPFRDNIPARWGKRVGAETGKPPARRPLRRHVRIHCAVSIGPHSFNAFTRNVSAEGMYLLVRRQLESELAVGQAARVRLELPDDGSSIDCPGELAWIDQHDQDIDNAPAIGMGVELHVDDVRLARLRAFVEHFRYAILVIGGTVADRARFQSAL